MWLTCVETEGHGLVEDELLNAEQQGDEFLLMGLRLREGIDPQRYLLLTGKKLAQSRNHRTDRRWLGGIYPGQSIACEFRRVSGAGRRRRRSRGLGDCLSHRLDGVR